MRRIDTGQNAATQTGLVEDVVDISALLAAFWRGRLIIALACVFSMLLGGIYAYRLATPMYRSTAVVMLNNREEQVVDLGSVMSGLGSDSTVINTEVEVLKSRVLLGKVVDSLSLIRDPEFNKILRPLSPFEKIKGLLRNAFAENSENTSTGPNEDRRREATIDTLLSRLSIRNVPQSLVFQVTVETESREKSSEIADKLVDLYILNQLEAKFEATEQATSWLSQRVADLQISLEEAESEVKDFRANTSLVSPEAFSALEVQVKETRDRIQSMEVARNAAEERLSSLKQADDAKEQAQVSNDPQLLRLLSQTDGVEGGQNFRDRFQQIVLRAEADLNRIDLQLDALRASLGELERQTDQQSRDLIALQQLTREAEASRLLYEYFLSRLKETSAQQGVQQADSRIISPAVMPVQASSPRKPLILAMSGLLGAMFGATFVVIREMGNRTFRTAAQLEAATGYATIGQIPLIKSRRRRDGIAYLREHPSSAAAEAVRNLRTSVMLSNIDNPPQVIMTSSALPGEGKTTIAMSLALNCSAMGKRVLLIEGDIRRRVFSLYLKAEQDQGIVSVLSGEASFDQVVEHSDLLGADVLLGGKLTTNAADIFSSNRFRDLVSYLRSRYDVIIVDTPPVLVVPDARLISQNVDAILFVVRWDRTQKEQVTGALREFESVGARVSGLVLNQISPKGMKRYGYGGQYGPYSSYGANYYLN